MDATALAVVVKAARKEAAKATEEAVKAASNKFGKVISEFSDRLDKSEKSANARIDKVDSKHRKTLGELADEQKRIKEGLGSTNKTITELASDVSSKTKELLKSVRELPAPEDGKDANRWHLTQGKPDPELGDDDDFALDGNNSDIWHKEDGEWEFVVHLKHEAPMLMQPRAYSEAKIREIAQVTPISDYQISDEDSASDVRYYGYQRENTTDWYILKVDCSIDPITYRYAAGASDYATNWTNRASLTYARLDAVDL